MCRLRPTLRPVLRPLLRGLLRPVFGYVGPGRRPPRPNDLAIACRLLNQVVRLHEKWAREDPELWGPGWIERDLRRLEREQQNREIDAAIRRIYGPATTP